MNKKVKAIRSLRVANELTSKGHRILGIEKCLDNPRLMVFIFKDTPELQQVLTESNRKYSAD